MTSREEGFARAGIAAEERTRARLRRLNVERLRPESSRPYARRNRPRVRGPPPTRGAESCARASGPLHEQGRDGDGPPPARGRCARCCRRPVRSAAPGISGIDRGHVTVWRHAECLADGRAVSGRLHAPQIDRAAVFEQPQLNGRRAVSVRDRGHRDVDRGIAQDRLRRRDTDDFPVARRGSRPDPDSVDRGAGRRAGGRIDAAVVAAIGQEDDPRQRPAAIPIPHGLQRGAEARAPIRRRERRRVRGGYAVAEPQHFRVEARRNGGQQVVLDERARAVDPARPIGVGEPHAARRVDEDGDDGVGGGVGAAHHGPHEAEHEPGQRRKAQRREEPAPRRGNRHAAVSQPCHEDGGGGDGHDGPRRKRVAERHFLMTGSGFGRTDGVAIASKYRETRPR